MAHFRKFRYTRKNLAKIFHSNRVIANFVPNFVANAIGSIQWPIPEEPSIGAKISQLGDVMVSDITFLCFLLFSMCHSLHVAVNKCIN